MLLPQPARLALVALAGAAAMTGCGKEKGAPDKVPSDPASADQAGTASAGSDLDQPPATRAEVKAHMKDHFTQVVEVRDAIIAGDLEAARKPSAWLAEHGAPEGIPDPWRPFVDQLKLSAKMLERAKTIPEFAVALGGVAQACGQCHREMQTEVVTAAPMPPAGESAAEKMKRHEWAANRLWAGLIGPSDEAWSGGAEVLTELPMSSEAIPAESSEQVQVLVTQIEKLSKDASAATDIRSRAALYGDLLSTCASCHTLVRPAK